jgi:hypothetical protein
MVGVGVKFDYPPLLAPGRHGLSLMDFKARFVDPFEGEAKATRLNLFQKLEAFVQEFMVSGMRCEIWIDGSILTEKPEPEDVDVAVILDHDVPKDMTLEQKLLFAKAETAGAWSDIDCFGFIRRGKSDPPLWGRTG